MIKWNRVGWNLWNKQLKDKNVKNSKWLRYIPKDKINLVPKTQDSRQKD